LRGFLSAAKIGINEGITVIIFEIADEFKPF
jgi:hypothetical protein